MLRTGVESLKLAIPSTGMAALAFSLALMLRLGPGHGALAAARLWPLLVVACLVRGALFAWALRGVPSGDRGSTDCIPRLVAVTAAGSAVLVVLFLGPFAPTDRPGFSRAALALEAVGYLMFSMVQLHLPRPSAVLPPRRIAVAAIVAFGLFAPMGGGARWETFGPDWPPHALRASDAPLVDAALEAWRATEPIMTENIGAYDPTGGYFHYADVWATAEPDSRLDVHGTPMVQVDGEYVYNPVTVAQYALAVHARHLEGEATLDAVRRAADALLDLEDPDGAFRYTFAWRYYLSGETIEPGWVSGMAQGQALSALARAYELTGDEAYLDGGRRALAFLLTPVADGGPMSDLRDLAPSLADRIFFEEYPSDPHSYTLNGYQFTLLGLYDWSQVSAADSSRERAAAAFDAGVYSLRGILPYYDVGGFSAYDLGHLTFAGRSPHLVARYHGVHVYLLHALFDITGEPAFAHFERLWTSYVDALDPEPASARR